MHRKASVIFQSSVYNCYQVIDFDEVRGNFAWLKHALRNSVALKFRCSVDSCEFFDFGGFFESEFSRRLRNNPVLYDAHAPRTILGKLGHFFRFFQKTSVEPYFLGRVRIRLHGSRRVRTSRRRTPMAHRGIRDNSDATLIQNCFCSLDRFTTLHVLKMSPKWPKMAKKLRSVGTYMWVEGGMEDFVENYVFLANMAEKRFKHELNSFHTKSVEKFDQNTWNRLFIVVF